MEDTGGLSETYARSSPWPMLVVLGFVLAELGILFGGVLFPLAVGGVVLFIVAVAGILTESGYVRSPWHSGLVLSGVVLVAGVALIGLDSMGIAPAGFNVAARGEALLIASVLTSLASGLFWSKSREHTQ